MQQPPQPMNNDAIKQQNMPIQVQDQMGNIQQEMVYKTLEEKLMSDQFENGCIIKQKLDIMEALSFCEFENTYYIYLRDSSGKIKKGEKQFKFQEKASCRDRCMSASCKPYKMKVKN